MSGNINIHNWTHPTAVILLAVATIGLIIITSYAVILKSQKTPETCRVEIVYSPLPDSLANSSEIYITQDKLDSVVKKLEHHEALLENKYQTMLSQKADEEWMRDLFVYVFGIVVAVLGFFGYRSFADMEKNISEKAKEGAKEAAREAADAIVPNLTETKVNSECSTKIPEKVTEYLNANLNARITEKIDAFLDDEGKNIIVSNVERVVNLQLEQCVADKVREQFAETYSQDSRNPNAQDSPESDGHDDPQLSSNDINDML